MHHPPPARTRHWRLTPRPADIPRPGLRQTLVELALVALVTFAYFLTRGLVRGEAGEAFRHANEILAIERALHLAPEHALQALALRYPWMMVVANYFYLYAHLPVLLAVGVWVYVARHWAYAWFRNAFLFSAIIGLSIYVVLPVAPPRFLPDFVDTLMLYGFDVDGSKAGPLYNPYAAMPSLHVGWSLLAGIAMIVCARTWWMKAAGAALPVVMTLAVIITGNHYLLDVLAGVAVALVALLLSALTSSWQEARRAARSAPALIPAADGQRERVLSAESGRPSNY